MSSQRPRWGPLRSLLALAPVLIGAPWFSLRIHTALPEPLVDLTNPITSLPQISESRILEYAKFLSEDIGYRTLGSREHALADAWMLEQAEGVKADCERIVRESGRKLECEVWRQVGSGTHRFDLMGKRLYKTYVNITNIIIRVSDGTQEGKEHALLINAHLDSTLPSPGAADDAVCVGIMLDNLRVLLDTPGWSPKHAVVFLFNNAEESLCDGSHLFATQHPTASTIRAVVNLEAAGTTGRELLFQATSEEVIDAYSRVPRPFGTVFANEVFSSGVILSDTDFRQFELYLNVTGLDIAIIGNSYLYHMRKDLVENIQPGVPQNMAENVLSLLRYFTSADSPLPSLTAGYSPPSTVYFSHLGYFFIYSFATAKWLYGLLLFSSIVFIKLSHVKPASPTRRCKSMLWEQARGSVFIFGGIAGTWLGSNAVATTMRYMNKSMSWFSREYSPLALYGPPALLGALVSQFLLGPIEEQTMFNSLLFTQSLTAFVIQMFNIGSAAMFYISALPLFIVLVLNRLIGKNGQLSLWAYAFGQIAPLLTSTILITSVSDVFVPLMGRIGEGAPADHIVASIIALGGAQALPLVLPFAHRFSRRVLLRAILLTGAMTAVAMAVFSTWEPFDQMHQKRLFVLHMENITTHEYSLHVSAADGAPGFGKLVNDIATEFGAVGASSMPVMKDDGNSDWDTIYPFSAFITAHKVDLPLNESHTSLWSSGENFTVSVTQDTVDEAARTRSLTVEVYHPGLIWTVIAFDAHVLEWSLDDNPPNEFARHRIREASFYGIDRWSMHMTIKLPSGNERLQVHYVGIQETGMWPGKKAEKEQGGRAMELFEVFDEWLEKKSGGTIDATLLSCVGGVAVI